MVPLPGDGEDGMAGAVDEVSFQVTRTWLDESLTLLVDAVALVGAPGGDPAGG